MAILLSKTAQPKVFHLKLRVFIAKQLIDKLILGRTYWLCSKKFSAKCHARVVTELSKNSNGTYSLNVISQNGSHTHSEDQRVVSKKK
jgi:hypothetical protein